MDDGISLNRLLDRMESTSDIKSAFNKLVAERDRYREDLEFVHKALAWEERRCGRLHGVLQSAINRTRATLYPSENGRE